MKRTRWRQRRRAGVAEWQVGVAGRGGRSGWQVGVALWLDALSSRL
ncbi:MAG: hypothetical protein HOH65_01840 [Rhodospirillaceae bacterium]|nr:hypothetical protein [Rhodospirillaceae bacterium]